MFRLFCEGEAVGITDDNLKPLVVCNFDSPISFGWFRKIWQEHFPYLYTESDSPQCPECYAIDISIKALLVAKDMTGYYAKKREKGSFMILLI